MCRFIISISSIPIIVVGLTYGTIGENANALGRYFLGPFVINNDNNMIAFPYAPRLETKRSYPEPDISKIKIGLLKIKEISSNYIDSIDVGMTFSMIWRERDSSQELFVAKNHYSLLKNRATLLSFNVSDNEIISGLSEVNHKGMIILGMSWNPEGKIIAFNIYIDRLLGKDKRCLGVSFDNGKNIILTDIIMRTRDFVWIGSDTLYIVNEGKILQIDMGNQKPQMKRTVFSGKVDKVRLFGQIEGKIVYRSDSKIYCGSQLIYEVAEDIVTGIAEGSYIAIATDNSILVLDKKGGLVGKRVLPENTTLVAISSDQKCIYLRKNLKTIERYNFEDDSEYHTVFDVDKLEVCTVKTSSTK